MKSLNRKLIFEIIKTDLTQDEDPRLTTLSKLHFLFSIN